MSHKNKGNDVITQKLRTKGCTSCSALLTKEYNFGVASLMSSADLNYEQFMPDTMGDTFHRCEHKKAAHQEENQAFFSI